MELSIIIPVYNAQDYLEECIESIIGEINLNDKVEILLIDDGSTDDSFNICEKYSEKYNNIKAIHTKNNGVSTARNIGIEKSKGKYIMFVDSDDELVKGWYDEIRNVINENEHDIVFFSKNCKEENVSKKDILKRMLWLEKGNISYGTPWSKIIRRKLIIENNIQFMSKIINWEDLIFLIQIINCSQTYKHISKGIYKFRNNLSSSTHKFNEKLIKYDSELCKNLRTTINQSKYLNIQEKELLINQFILLNLTMLCGRISYIPRYKEAKKKFDIFKNSPYCNVKLANITLKRTIIILLIKMKMNVLVYYFCKINNYMSYKNNKQDTDYLKII